MIEDDKTILGKLSTHKVMEDDIYYLRSGATRPTRAIALYVVSVAAERGGW